MAIFSFCTLGHYVQFLCFRSEKIQNLMRGGGGSKKKIKEKKNIEPFFGKVNEADEKNKQKKNIAGKMFFCLLK